MPMKKASATRAIGRRPVSPQDLQIATPQLYDSIVLGPWEDAILGAQPPVDRRHPGQVLGAKRDRRKVGVSAWEKRIADQSCVSTIGILTDRYLVMGRVVLPLTRQLTNRVVRADAHVNVHLPVVLRHAP